MTLTDWPAAEYRGAAGYLCRRSRTAAHYPLRREPCRVRRGGRVRLSAFHPHKKRRHTDRCRRKPDARDPADAGKQRIAGCSPIAQINGMHKGALRLGVFNSACVTWLPKIVPGFRAAFPGIDVQIYQGSYDDITGWLKTAR